MALVQLKRVKFCAEAPDDSRNENDNDCWVSKPMVAQFDTNSFRPTEIVLHERAVIRVAAKTSDLST